VNAGLPFSFVHLLNDFAPNLAHARITSIGMPEPSRPAIAVRLVLGEARRLVRVARHRSCCWVILQVPVLGLTAVRSALRGICGHRRYIRRRMEVGL
jgi:hypothetical protein